MDFGTSREKRLEGISLTLSEKPLSSVTVVIKYKTADGGSYVTAVTSAAPSTQRVEVTDLGIAFQQIKFYVGLTDTNAIDDVAIDKLSVLYTKPS